MNDASGGAAGLMIIRLWTETGDRMRVRITCTTELASDRPVTAYASTRTEVLERVEDWLDALVTPR